jgi:hypothetical protein
MGIWTWMTKRKSSRVHGRPGRLVRSVRPVKFVPTLVLVCLIPAGTAVAAPSVGFRLIPGYTVPIGDTVFQYGVGGGLAVDFMPVSFFGFVAEGEYMNLGRENVSSIHLINGNIGLTGVWRLADRWSLRAEALAGAYTVKGSISLSGISAGARGSATYRISPELAVSLQAAYRTFLYRPQPFMNSVSVGASVEINLSELLGSETRVSVSAERQDSVFPVFYSWYDDNSFALVKVTNGEDAEITDVSASFFLEQYMGQPKLCATSRQGRVVRRSRQGVLQRIDACPYRENRGRGKDHRRVPRSRIEAARRISDFDPDLRPERDELGRRSSRCRLRVLERSRSALVFEIRGGDSPRPEASRD